MKTTILLLFLFISNSILAQPGFIVNHQHTDLSQIPDNWIDSAQANLRVHYFRASHGSQVDDGGMTALENYFGEKYKFRAYESPNSLFLTTSTECVDCDYTADWAADTRNYLDNAANANVNTVMWAWSFNFYGYTIQSYLDAMEALISEYGSGGTKIISGDRTVPVTFVFQTACSLMGNVQNEKIFIGNKLIRQHCIDNNRVLFDFNDIECYNPDGEYFGEAAADGVTYEGLKRLDDDVSYIIDPNVPETRGNWGTEWMAANPTNELSLLADDLVCVSCAHSMGSNSNEENSRLHCVLKGRAAWWMWAKLAGWNTKSVDVNPDQALTETNLNGRTLSLSITGDSFTDNTLSSANFILNNAPVGTSIQSVSYVNATSANIVLAFDGSDFDTDINNFNISILAAELSGAENLGSNLLTITAVVEGGTPALQISSANSLTESTLNNSVVQLSLTNITFVDNSLSTGNFQLNNVPTGVDIQSVNYTDATHANIVLAFDGSDFDTDYTNFSVTIAANEINQATEITSNTSTIFAELEPQATLVTSSELTESELDNVVLNIQLDDETFDSRINIADLVLNNQPEGLSIASLSFQNELNIDVTLSFDNTNFDNDITNFSVTILANALSGTEDLTTNEKTILAETVSSIEQITAVKSLSVFPNPSTGIFKLKLDLAHQITFNMSVRDLSGKIIISKEYKGNAGSNLIEFDISNSQSGVKIILLKFDNKQVSVPIITH